MPTTEGLLYLPRSVVEEVCARIDAVEVVRVVFHLHGSGQTVLPDEACLAWTTERGDHLRSLNMPAYVGGPIQSAGTKIINANICNPRRGQPRASGLTLLFDSGTGQVACVMEGTHISALRTAAASFLAVELLIGAPIRRMAVLGSGPIGSMHVRMGIRRLPALESLALFDLNRNAANALEDTARIAGGEAYVAPSAETAVRDADLLITCTTVTEGYVPYEWLKAGAIAINASLDDLLPDAYLRSDLLFVDDWSLVQHDTRRLLGKLYRQGRIAGPGEQAGPQVRQVDGELSDLVLGRHPGRRSPKDVVVVNPFGLGIEDVALASFVYRRAIEDRLGIRLER